jgi:kynurenine formamidase
MHCFLSLDSRHYKLDFSLPIDISMPMHSGSARAWYMPPLDISPVRMKGFAGDVQSGGSVNFRNIFFNPHAHGTHTECVGHITPKIHSVSLHVQQFMHPSLLVTVQPVYVDGDRIITADAIPDAGQMQGATSLIIRTTPNTPEKLHFEYSNSNPPYIAADAMQKIVDNGVLHLLIDLPSVDRESDGGALQAHHVFWGWPNNPRMECSITELVYIPDAVTDGLYLLNLSFPAFENDASPSRAILYALTAAD